MASELFGWIGAIAYSICAAPQAIKCWRQGHGLGLSSGMLCVWLIGGVSMLIAIPLRYGFIPWLMTSYIGNTAALLVIMRYRFWPRELE